MNKEKSKRHTRETTLFVLGKPKIIETRELLFIDFPKTK
jgi:hypothetical protein